EAVTGQFPADDIHPLGLVLPPQLRGVPQAGRELPGRTTVILRGAEHQDRIDHPPVIPGAPQGVQQAAEDRLRHHPHDGSGVHRHSGHFPHLHQCARAQGDCAGIVVPMNTRVHNIRTFMARSAAALAVGTGGVLLVGAFPVSTALATTTPATMVVAEAPELYADRVTDYTGTLSSSEVSAIEEAINQTRVEEQREIFVVFLNSFDGVDPDTWTQQALATNGGGNVLIYA